MALTPLVCCDVDVNVDAHVDVICTRVEMVSDAEGKKKGGQDFQAVVKVTSNP